MSLLLFPRIGLQGSFLIEHNTFNQELFVIFFGLLRKSQPITIPIKSTTKINTEREIKKVQKRKLKNYLLKQDKSQLLKIKMSLKQLLIILVQ